jgi:hypothetical protein
MWTGCSTALPSFRTLSPLACFTPSQTAVSSLAISDSSRDLSEDFPNSENAVRKLSGAHFQTTSVLTIHLLTIQSLSDHFGFRLVFMYIPFLCPQCFLFTVHPYRVSKNPREQHSSFRSVTKSRDYSALTLVSDPRIDHVSLPFCSGF